MSEKYIVQNCRSCWNRANTTVQWSGIHGVCRTARVLFDVRDGVIFHLQLRRRRDMVDRSNWLLKRNRPISMAS